MKKRDIDSMREEMESEMIEQQYKQYKKAKRKKKRRKTVGTIVLLIFLFAMMSGDSDTEKTAEDIAASSTEASSSISTPKPTKTPRPASTPKQTPVPTAEPSTLQEWAEYVAQSVYGKYDDKYTELISVSCEQVDGESSPMIIINAKYPDSFMRKNDSRMGSFLYSVMNVNWKLADLAKEGKIKYGSVYIHGRTTFLDKYGNETEGDAANIRIKASEAAKVNWSNRTVVAEMMPGIAVSFMIHPIIRDGLSIEYLNKIR